MSCIKLCTTVNFAFIHSADHVTFSHSGSGNAGETYSLSCSAILILSGILPTGTPTPTFQWFFGPNGNAFLPSGLTTPATTSRMATIVNIATTTFTSTLQFSPLSQSHAGNYTCRIGAGRLVNSAMVTANGIMYFLWFIDCTDIYILLKFFFGPAPTISVQITASGPPVVGQSYSLTCTVTGAENLSPSITYQWTKNNGAQTQIGADRVLSFSSLRLSDAGQYTCQATVSSSYLNNDITIMDTHDVRLQSKHQVCMFTAKS